MGTLSTKGREGDDEVGLSNLASGINVMRAHCEWGPIYIFGSTF